MLLIVFFIASAAVFRVDAQLSCTTVGNTPGICVPKMTCGFIRQLLKAWNDPPPNHIVEFIQRTQCGALNGVTYVCCSRNEVSSEGLTAPQPMQLTGTTQRTTTTTTPRPTLTDPRIRRVPIRSEQEIATGMDILRSMRCGNANADRVANGEDASLGEFPWMVLLVYDDGVQSSLDCGGSLITDQYVLTAAHCIRFSFQVRLARVRLGEFDTKENPDCVGRKRRKCAPPYQEIDVEEAIYHQDYDRSRLTQDIGLIRMVRKATLGDYVTPVCLPITPSSENAVVPKMQIAGWGRIETGLKASVLQKARVIIKENTTCQKVYQLITVTNAHLCAGGDSNIATCFGDSGGPLFFAVRYRRGTRAVQYGVVGGGSSLCGSHYPDVFASTLAHLNWIAGNIRP